MKKDAIPYSEERAWNYCLWLLSRRGYTEHEIRQKLTRKQVDEDIQAGIIHKLYDYQFIGDNMVAQSEKRNMLELQGKGKNALRQKLMKRGIDKPMQEEVLDDISEEDEYENACKQLAKRQNRWDSHDLENFEDKMKCKQKMLQYLSQKGFDYNISKKAIENYLHSHD